MRIAFATTQSVHGSTNVGRIMPLAEKMAVKGAACFVLVQARPSPASSPATAPPLAGPAGGVKLRVVGTEPFRRTSAGKRRLKGWRLVRNMLATSVRTAWALRAIQPDVIIMSKPLPANVLGVWLYTASTWLSGAKLRIILDADDFELTANQLSSLYQRGAIHWSERRAAKLAAAIVVASPFLSDHFKQLTQNTKPIKIIPTGIATELLSFESIENAAGGELGAPRPLEQPHHRAGVHSETGPASQGYPPPALAYLGSVSVSSGHRVDLLPDILEQCRRQNPAMRLLIAGDGDDLTKLKEEFSRRNLTEHVTWFGRFSLDELGQLVTARTIIIDPVDDSIANRAKSSFRVLLAVALGVPVVTSNIGIRPRLVPAQFHERFFADPGDPASYAQKSVALSEHTLTDTERHELQQHASAYTWPRLAASYYAMLKV